MYDDDGRSEDIGKSPVRSPFLVDVWSGEGVGEVVGGSLLHKTFS